MYIFPHSGIPVMIVNILQLNSGVRQGLGISPPFHCAVLVADWIFLLFVAEDPSFSFH
jgi:hypothetical protein